MRRGCCGIASSVGVGRFPGVPGAGFHLWKLGPANSSSRSFHVSLSPSRGRSTPDNAGGTADRNDFRGMAVVFLGTGSSVPTPDRNVTSIAVKLESRTMMFDCGEATQHQFMKCQGLTVQTVEHIFITHLHGDHIMGLGGVVHGVCCGVDSNREEPLHIYGPPGIRRYVHTILQTTRPSLDLPVFVHELVQSDLLPSKPSNQRMRDTDIPMDEATGTWNVYSDKKITVRAAPLLHKVPCWGYVLQETDTTGSINVELCSARGLAPGPLYKELKKGNAVTLPDGTLLHPSEVVGPTKIGRKLVILGDTCDSSGIAKIGQGADLLIHECTLPRRLATEARKRGHSTATMAGKFAKRIQAKKLILTHFSARTTVAHEESVEDMVTDAKHAFGGPVIAAHDYMWEQVFPPQ